MSLDIHTQSNPRKGFLLSLAATVLMSSNWLTAKYALRGFDPWTFSMLWTSAAAVYVFIIVLITGRVRKVVLPRRSLPAMIYLGLFTAAAMILQWASLSMIGPAFQSFLFRFAPLLTILLAVIFLREALPLRLILPGVVMIAGGLISAVARWDIVALGTALALLACFATAVQRLIAKKKVSELHPTIIVFYRVLIGAAATSLLVLVTGKTNFNVQGKYWAAMLLGAFMGPCMGHLLMFQSFFYWDLSRSSMILTAQPLIVLPLAYLVLGQFPAPMELVGGIIILAGAFWLVLVYR